MGIADPVLIGTVSGSSPQSITVPAGGVPSGAHIIVFASDASLSHTAPSISDTAGNTYLNNQVENPNGSTLNGQGSITRARTGLALSPGDTITYTAVTPGALVNIAAISATGLKNVGSAGGSTGTGNSTAASVSASGTNGDLAVGCVVSNLTQASMPQATGFNSPPGLVSLVQPALVAGWRIISGSPTTYALTLGTSAPWADMISFFEVLPDPAGQTLICM